ncbi:Lysine histidine transporter-like 8 [Fagus crenata]
MYYSSNTSPLSFSASEDIEIENTNKSPTQDAWLPITESRNGNAYYAAFHILCSGIGIQALLLPVAFIDFGWKLGIICLTLLFMWQFYTIYLLVELHESAETGMRYCRYLQLCKVTFDDKIAYSLLIFPIIDLSAVLSQLPNLNSLANVSLIGAISYVSFCTLLWVVPVAEGRLPNLLHNPVQPCTQISRLLGVVNGLGFITLAFGGHDLILEIQLLQMSNMRNL